MRQRIIIFCLVILIQPFTGCENTYEKKVNKILSEIEKEYCPDGRIALFDVTFVKKKPPKITGETNLVNAFNELDSTLKTDFPEIEFKVDLLPSESLDSSVYALITISVANLRSSPRHSAELITQVILGSPVRILKKEENWYLIQTPDSYLGWTTESSISQCTENELKNYNHSDRIIFTDLNGTCYAQPERNSIPVSDMVAGSILQKTDENLTFWKVRFPDGRSGFVDKNQCKHFGEWNQSCIQNHQSVSQDEESDFNKVITTTAMRFIGLPYLWGGTSSKGLDCSGFTKTVYFLNGIILQRDASQQVLYGDPVDASAGYENLEPADLLFFGDHKTDSTIERVTHVGIYIGNGEIIHSSSGASRVKINSLFPGTENYNDDLNSSFICARRILTCIGEPGIEPVLSHELYGGTVSQIYLNERR